MSPALSHRRPRSAVHSAGAARPPCRGLFVCGTDTAVGKTFVSTRIVAALRRAGVQVGVYKPAASGCRREHKRLVSDDAVALWEAAGRPGRLASVCPQRFAAPLAPHIAAREEQREIDARLLRRGLNYWTARSEVVVVEGAGGLMSPLGDREYIADLARDFGFPLIVVTANRIGAINQTLQTLIAAQAYGQGLTVAGIVLNDVHPPELADPSIHSNRAQLEMRCVPPILGHLRYGSERFDPVVDWSALAAPAKAAAH